MIESNITSKSAARLSTEHTKVLIVDDQLSNIIALEAVFASSGYELVKARSGEEAIRLLAEDEFAVILLDIQMPKIDGYQTARLIRRRERAGSTPIIFLTATYPDEKDILQGYQVGAVDFLLKPLNTEILRAKVRVFVELFRTRRTLERQSVFLEELESREKALIEGIRLRDEFLSVASHELRTPITPLQLQMQGFSRLLEAGKVDDASPEHIKEMLDISDAQLTRLTRLISQLLDASRITAGRFNLHPEEFDLSEAVSETLTQLRHEIQNAECTVRLNLQPNVHGKWDRLRIEQILLNLMTNALKFAPGTPIEISITADSEHARISVKDYGIGVAEKDHLRIFDRFERAVSVKHFGGLGLGLYIARQIVELHRGEIWVESELGKGATFIVVLPLMRN